MLDPLKKYFQRKSQPDDLNFRHRVLNTNIKNEPELGQDSIFFGCGSFWGAEKCFWKLPGIITTSVGYAGGNTKDPNYYDVCSGVTGHAEVVNVIWNTELIDISDLLKMFWECHDPTQKNRQGNDVGTQYRSSIFYKDIRHKTIIESSKKAYQKELNLNNHSLIETDIKQINDYFFAEEYHQQYLAIKGSRPYCSASPTQVKLGKFKGSNFKLNKEIWDNFDWSIDKCVLRSNNEPLKIVNQ